MLQLLVINILYKVFQQNIAAEKISINNIHNNNIRCKTPVSFSCSQHTRKKGNEK